MSPALNYDCAPDTLDFEWIAFTYLTGFVDRPIHLQKPRTVLALTNATGATPGPTLHISLVPTSVPLAGGSPIFLGDLPIITFPLKANRASPSIIKFCKPVSRFFLSAADPGALETVAILCTSDLEIIFSGP